MRATCTSAFVIPSREKLQVPRGMVIITTDVQSRFVRHLRLPLPLLMLFKGHAALQLLAGGRRWGRRCCCTCGTPYTVPVPHYPLSITRTTWLRYCLVRRYGARRCFCFMLFLVGIFLVCLFMTKSKYESALLSLSACTVKDIP